MIHARSRLTLLSLAVALAAAGAAFGLRPSIKSAPGADAAVESVEPFAVAALLAEAPPDTVVITLDDAKHPLRGAIPASMYGADDAAFVAQAPKARRVILAGADPVRVDRVARKLRSGGRRAAVLKGGIGAWDRAMDADPPAPPATASAAAFREHRASVALRRSFGDAEAAPAAPIAAPAAPIAAPSGPKKREGC